MVYQSITRELIDSDLVYKNLVNRYMKRMAKSFNDQYYHEVSTETADPVLDIDSMAMLILIII